MESQQIGVSSDDQMRPSIQGELEKFVVFGIAAFADWIDNWHELSYAPKQSQELLTVCKTDIAVELRSEPRRRPARSW
jgi:hypothetical protein